MQAIDAVNRTSGWPDPAARHCCVRRRPRPRFPAPVRCDNAMGTNRRETAGIGALGQAGSEHAVMAGPKAPARDQTRSLPIPRQKKPAPIVMLCASPYGAASDGGPIIAGDEERALRDRIREELDCHAVGVGYCCPASGPGLVFAEEMLARGGELHIYLPYPVDAFVAEQREQAGAERAERFEAVRARATRVEISCEERLVGDGTLLRFNNQMLQGMARLHADRVGGRARLLAIWSPTAPAGAGSPGDFIDQWPELEHLSLIDLDELGATTGGDLSSMLNAMAIGDSPLVVRAIFFADLATYSALGDDQVPLLWDFLAEVQNQVDALSRPPILINTWGDAIHAAAETAIDLAGYATTLVESTARLDFSSFGLKTQPRFRVALHAGPVYVGLHPLTGRSMVFGHHVNRAARIEPIAEPGEILASQHFVALLRAEMDARLHEASQSGMTYRREYALEYVGNVELPKKFGHEAVYRIRSMASADGRV